LNQLLTTIILGIIQGLTEWLPISSTGHLKIVEHFVDFSLSENLFFDFILHTGTLIVVLFFFRREIKSMLFALVHLDFKTEYGRLVPLIIVGTLPAAIVGVVFETLIEKVFQNLLLIGIAFLLCGIILYFAKVGREKTNDVSYLTAMAVGIAEGIAIVPGLSRSGLTIAVALLLGIKREKAFQFSFLLSIPAIIGVIVYTAIKDFDKLAFAGLDWIEILAGVIAAMIVGYLALKLLWKVLAKKKFHIFAFYCWVLGLILIALFLGGA